MMFVRLRHFDLPIRYEFPQLTQGATDIRTAMGTMNTRLSDLDASIRPKLAAWEGGANGNYEARKARWDAAARNIETLLTAVAGAVDRSSEDMAATEMRNAIRMSGGR